MTAFDIFRGIKLSRFWPKKVSSLKVVIICNDMTFKFKILLA